MKVKFKIENPVDTLQVRPVETTDESLAKAMGISKKREKELDVIIDYGHANTQTYTEAMKIISANCKNVNEITYACFHLGAFAESQRSKNKLIYRLLGE